MNNSVYTFGGGAAHDDVRAKDKTIVGGKGANLAEMAGIGLPVPPGFTITTVGCVALLQQGADFNASLHAEALTHIEQAVGKKFGHAADPLLVSVRSGARVSMPGMMANTVQAAKALQEGAVAEGGLYDDAPDRRMFGIIRLID